MFLSSYRKTYAEMREPLKKADSELIGQRLQIERDGKEPVMFNLYIPENSDNELLPVVFNIHGGGFVAGDADALDTQGDRIANEWNAIIVTVNYTTADVNRFTIMGYSAGAYYSAEAMRLLKDDGFDISSLVLCYPWTMGLPTDNLSIDCPRTLFVLAGQDPISQRSKTYRDNMEKAGIAVKNVEYDEAVHSFIESNNPESANETSKDFESVITPEQEKLAREAEKMIGEWLKEE